MLTLTVMAAVVSGQLDLTAFGDAQVNGRFTQHAGFGAQVGWRLSDEVALTFGVFGNPIATSNTLADDLINKTRIEAPVVPLVVLKSAALLGVEVTPLRVRFTKNMAASLTLSSGVGAGSLQVQLKWPIDCSNASGACFAKPSYGDLGFALVSEVGAGLRVHFGDSISLRVEVRDVLYSGSVDTINGCDKDDLKNLNMAATAGGPAPMTSPGCNTASFRGSDSDGRPRVLDVPLAFGTVRTPSGGLIHNVGLYLGTSVTF